MCLYNITPFFLYCPSGAQHILYKESGIVVKELIKDGFQQELVDQVVKMVDLAEYKRRQTPLGPRVTTKGFGRDRRLPVVNRYDG